MITRLIKWIIRTCLMLMALVAIVVLLLFLFRDTVLRKTAEYRIRAASGMQARIGQFHIGVTEPVVTIQDFKLYNTPEFGGSLLLSMPELHIEYDLDAIQSGQLRLRLVRVNLEEVTIVRSEAERTNIVAFLERMHKVATQAARKRTPATTIGFAGIDTFNLSLGTIRFEDLLDPQQDRELRLDLEDQVFKNVRSEADLYAIVFLVMQQKGAGFLGTPNAMPEGLFTNPLESFESGLWRFFQSLKSKQGS